MFAPIGFRPITEIEEFAMVLAQERQGAALEKLAETLQKLPKSPETLSEFNLLVGQSWNEEKLLRYQLVDAFLEQVERLFLASPSGHVLEVSKRFVLPNGLAYLDEEEYLACRTSDYRAIDTELWVIDAKKLGEKNDLNREFLNDLVSQNVRFDENTNHQLIVEGFDGWALVVREVDFPNSPGKLEALRDEAPNPSELEGAVFEQILTLTLRSKITKSEVRNFFPRLSARAFEYHWKKAAEERPELSKPGRKS